MASKEEQKAQADFDKNVEKSREAMAKPVDDREAWAVLDNESGAYMLAGVFDSEKDAEGHVRRLVAKRATPGVDSGNHVFIAELSAAKRKYDKHRKDGLSKSDLKKPTRPDVSKRGSDSAYADKEALDESEVRPLQ